MKQFFFNSSICKIYLCLLPSFLLLFIIHQSTAQTITADTTGHQGNFFYFFDKDTTQSASMVLGPAGNYKAQWNKEGNFKAGKGWEQGSATRVIHFSGVFSAGNNGNLAVYGWTKNPVREYYIVENYGVWTPPGGKSKGTVESDSGTYNIYQVARREHPSINSILSYEQYWSVRTTKRSHGTVTFANHVEAWKKNGMELGTSFDYQIMLSEGYMSTGSANITVSESSPITSVSGEAIMKNPAAYDIVVSSNNQLVLTNHEAVKPCYINLYNLTGAQVMTLQTDNAQTILDLTKLEDGIYLVKLSCQGNTVTKRIVKQ